MQVDFKLFCHKVSKCTSEFLAVCCNVASRLVAIMHSYKNLQHNSGISAYEIGEDFIKIEFSGETLYLYTYQSAGRQNIEKMKKLASAGEGLATFISQHVKDGYSTRLK